MLRQQMGSLRLLQNECIVFVPPGACRESTVLFEAVVLIHHCKRHDAYAFILETLMPISGVPRFLDYIKCIIAL